MRNGESHNSSAAQPRPAAKRHIRLDAPAFVNRHGRCPNVRAELELTVRSANPSPAPNESDGLAPFPGSAKRSRRSAGDTVSGNSAGSSRKMAAIDFHPVGRSNGGFAETHSKSTKPKLKISERWSTGSPRICSGDIYAAVPITDPADVCVAVRVSECAPAAAGCGLFRQTEIEDLGASIARQHDVFRLQIAMHDAGRVRRREGRGDLPGEIEQPAQRQGPALENLAQRFALDQFRDNESEAILFADIVNRDDIRMIERAGRRAPPARSAAAGWDRPQPAQEEFSARLCD